MSHANVEFFIWIYQSEVNYAIGWRKVGFQLFPSKSVGISAPADSECFGDENDEDDVFVFG
jgi:hypothetical protein